MFAIFIHTRQFSKFSIRHSFQVLAHDAREALGTLAREYDVVDTHTGAAVEALHSRADIVSDLARLASFAAVLARTDTIVARGRVGRLAQTAVHARVFETRALAIFGDRAGLEKKHRFSNGLLFFKIKAFRLPGNFVRRIMKGMRNNSPYPV